MREQAEGEEGDEERETNTTHRRVPSSFFLATVPNARVDILPQNGGRVYGNVRAGGPVTGKRKY